MKPVIFFCAILAATATNFVQATDQLKLDVQPVKKILQAEEKQTTWVRVGVEGFKLKSEAERPGVNLAIVLDKSGSMQGNKIKKAREAAIDAIKLLKKDDIISIITYDSTVNVLVPATKLTDKNLVIQKIKSIQPNGNTALFAGVSKGAAEVRKFAEDERVNRVILLSDGLANVGPSSPGELANLGKSLLKENIAVSTLGLGLGYNEDLMVQLANTSGGNHLFIEDAAELVDIFHREFDDVLSVVAQQIDIEVTIPEGIRPVRVLGNDADINGQVVVTRLAQIYSQQDRHFVIEVEPPKSEAGAKLKLATVSVSYTNMKTNNKDSVSGQVECEFSADKQAVQNSTNSAVLADVVALVSSEQSKLATLHLDAGNLAACQEVLTGNIAFLKVNALNCPTDSERLQKLATFNQWQLDQVSQAKSKGDVSSNRARKSLRSYQSEVDNQQRAKSSSGKR